MTLFVEHVSEDLFEEVDAFVRRRRRVALGVTPLLARSRPRTTYAQAKH